jgi:hypothetical protein
MSWRIDVSGENGWTVHSYAAFRTLLGLYLALHFAQLVPFGAEVWSSTGVLGDAALSPFTRIFPNLLAWLDAPGFITAALVVGGGLGLCLAAGVADRAAAVALWYLLACLFGRNPLTANPALPFVGWLLLAHAFAAPSRRQRASGDWHLADPIFACAWLVMAAGYSYGGFTKLASPSWLDGSALTHVLNNPLARPTALREWLVALPDAALHVATWGALTLELAYLPLALFGRARPLLWLAMVGMHATLLVLVDFADLTAGMLLLHAFTFDPNWGREAHRFLRRRREAFSARPLVEDAP